MSFEVTTGVWMFCRLPMSQKGVLLNLARHANKKTDLAWPSVETLARECNKTTRQIRKDLNTLKASGEIIAVGKMGKGNRIYRVAAAQRYREWASEGNVTRAQDAQDQPSSDHLVAAEKPDLNSRGLCPELQGQSGLNSSSAKRIVESKPKASLSQGAFAGRDLGPIVEHTLDMLCTLVGVEKPNTTTGLGNHQPILQWFMEGVTIEDIRDVVCEQLSSKRQTCPSWIPHSWEYFNKAIYGRVHAQRTPEQERKRELVQDMARSVGLRGGRAGRKASGC